MLETTDPNPLFMAKNITPEILTADQFIEQLSHFQSDEEAKKLQRYFKPAEGEEDVFMGVKMGDLFALAKSFGAMPIAEIEKLLDSPVHEIRAGGVSIMDKASRDKKTIESRRKEFYDLYMRRHDRINNWDQVDLGCLHMTGCYLFDKPRQVLFDLAKSPNQWERRTAILSTCYFIRQGQVDDTFNIAEMLLHDKEDLVHKATGWMLRFAGDKAPKRHLAFLDQYAAVMPRVLWRNMMEKLAQAVREYYLKLR